MSGGQQDAARAEKAVLAGEEAHDALDDLFKTAAFDRVFGLDLTILGALNACLERYGYEIRRKDR